MDKFSRRYRRHLRKALRYAFKGQYHTYMAKATYALDKVPEFEMAVESVQEELEDLVGVNTEVMPVGPPMGSVEVIFTPEDNDEA